MLDDLAKAILALADTFLARAFVYEIHLELQLQKWCLIFLRIEPDRKFLNISDTKYET